MTVSEAASIGDIEQLRALLEAGGDPNEAETEEYQPPLLEAAYSDHVEATRLLLDAGADMYAPHKGGETPLLMAIQQGSMGVFHLLLERGCRMDPIRENVPWLLTHTAGQGHLELVKWLLSQGVPVDLTDHSGCTALIRAAKNDHLAIVEELLRAGADPNHRDNDTETVLMWAADHVGNASVLRALLEAGADPNAQNEMQFTALYWVVRHGDPDMVQALLDGGVNIQPYDLSLAAENGFVPALRLLLKYGADITDGPELLKVARNHGQREIANLLQQAIMDRKLRDTGEDYPTPRYPVETRVRTLTGTPREGWIALAEWNYKHGRYGYYIEAEGTSQPRKAVSKRYWEEDLQPLENESTP